MLRCNFQLNDVIVLSVFPVYPARNVGRLLKCFSADFSSDRKDEDSSRSWKKHRLAFVACSNHADLLQI